MLLTEVNYDCSEDAIIAALLHGTSGDRQCVILIKLERKVNLNSCLLKIRI